ncbi:MAG: hypothetical protein ABFS16_12965 [Bacteroidota bacterium]
MMNRRAFLHYTGAASLISTGIISPSTLLAKNDFPEFDSFEKLVENLIKLNDERVPKIMELQDRNPGSKYYGGVHDSWKIFTPGSTGALIKILAISFIQPHSKFHLNESLIEPMELAIRYLLKVQHDDGTIDLLSTNFHSTPDTAFVVEPLCATYKLLRRAENEELKNILGLLERFLKRAGEAFIVGGVHTPNHRWVVSMAMSRLNELFPDERYIKRINEWLREGIDIDADGQYEERSTYIYTPLTNRCLVTMAKLLKRPELLEPVRKNLDMTLYYIHPNGEVATEASGRQDQFRVGFMEHYYVPLRYMALNDQTGQFANLVSQIEKTVPEKLSTYLVYLLEDNIYANSLPTPQPLPDNYLKEFPNSKLARIRKGNIDATVLADNPTFFTLSKGKAVLASVRLASAFFGRGQFKAETVERAGDSFILKWEFEWGYFQPLPEGEKPNYDIPFDEDRKRRDKSEVQKIKAQVTVSESNRIFELDFELEGTDNVPLAVEMAFRNGGTLTGVEIPKTIGATHFEKSFLLKNGTGKYSFEDDEIEFGTGIAEHEWTAIRGSLPKPDGDCVYLTGFTPFKKKITIG